MACLRVYTTRLDGHNTLTISNQLKSLEPLPLWADQGALTGTAKFLTLDA